MASDPCQASPPPGLRKGVAEFNKSRFYACHDTLEELWMAESRPVRQVYQGVLQIGVAFYHLEKARYRPAVTLLERGSTYLRRFAPTCMGLDIEGLLADVACCLAEVKRLGPENLNDFDRLLVPMIKIEG